MSVSQDWQVHSGRGLIQKPPKTEAFLAAALRLYRNDLLFKALTDLGIAGSLVLAFSLNWGSIASLVPDFGRSAPASVSMPSQAQLPSQLPQSIGLKIAEATETITVDIPTLQRVGQPLASKLVEAGTALNAQNAAWADQLLAGLDDRVPEVAYLKAAVVVQLPGLGRIAESQMLLRRAASQGVFPAYTLLGSMIYRMIVNDEKGKLPGSERVLVDDTGTAHMASRSELALAADLWWQRAGAFGRPEGLRYAGFAKARGLSGKTDPVAAAAMWRTAADAGDVLSQYELGNMLMLGQGVQPNHDDAVKYLRKAADTLPAAGIALAAALISESVSGDPKAAEEAMRAAQSVIDNSKNKEELALAHFELGNYLFQVAPASLRDLPRGVDEFEKAAKLGAIEAAAFAGAAYREGLGKPKDIGCALGFYMAAVDANPGKIKPIIAELQAQVDQRAKAVASSVSWELARSAPATGDFAYIPTHIKMPEEMTPSPPPQWRPICERAREKHGK